MMTFMRPLTRLGCALGVVGLLQAGLIAQAPALDDVLAKVASYHREYMERMSGVSLVEETRLMNVTGSVVRSTVRISSDVVFVALDGQVQALRDPFAVDTRPLRPREPRIMRLLGAPAQPTAADWAQAAGFPQTNAVYFLLDIVVKTNEPTSALQFVSPAHQPRLRYRLDGRKKINGVETVGLRFDEPEGRDQRYLLGTRRNARANGRVWVEPATGAIHMTELWADAKLEQAIVAVKYARHETLGLLLPVEMNDSYEERETGGSPRQIGDGADAHGNYVSRINVESRSVYSAASYARIDLTRLR
jgi:hypothetical protein